jgi:hypothetical protein
MTDKEIIQALRRCHFGAPCARCPAVSYKNCMDEMHKCAANLIERLTAENTALREGASLGKAKRPQKKAYEKSIEFLRALTDGQSDEIKSLRRELEWKDMVIALAQKEQAEAEAERDALLEIAKNGKDCDTCKNCAVCVKPGTDVAHWCDRCEEKCRCYGCGGDHWEWRGLPEEPEGGEKA